MNVIPAIDLRGGHVVRLRQGDYAAETIYPASPAETALAYAAAGASALHVVDLDAARAGAFANLPAIEAIVQSVRMPVQAGGGVRSDADLEALFRIGVARCVVGSMAVRHPELVLEWIARHGAARICIALDVRGDSDGVFRPAAAGWTEASAATLFELLATYSDAAPGLTLLCTDIACDGMLSGPNLALYARIRAMYPQFALLASGGIRDAEDLRALRALGCSGAIVGRALLDSPAAMPALIAC